MESTPQKPRNSEEVDFTHFFSWIGRGFSRMGRSFVYFLALLRNLFFQNLLFFAGIILAGLLLGWLYSELLKKDYYKSTMILGCDYVNDQVMENTINKLNLLADDPTHRGLAELLNIDSVTSQNILSFEFKSFVPAEDVLETELLQEQLINAAPAKKDLMEKVIERIEIQNKNAFEISVRVFDPSIVKPLEKPLVDYFQNNEYVRPRMAVARENWKKRKEQLERDSRKMDSLKVALFISYHSTIKSNRPGNNIVVSDEKIADPLEVFKQGLEINEEILQLETKLAVKPDFELVDGFSTFQQPETAGLAKVLLISALIAWIFGYLIIGLWKLDRMLAKYDLNKD